MLPRWHILLGLLFSLVFWIVFPETHWIYAAIIFLSAFLIDFDHYMNAVFKTGKICLFDAFEYHRRLIKKALADKKREVRKRGDFHIFHTIEFHIFTLVMGFIIHPVFFYILIGMVFHSIVDLISLIWEDGLYRREYFFVRWLARKMA